MWDFAYILSIKISGDLERAAMDLSGKKVGIWGFGRVGTAALEYLSTQSCSLTICDQKDPSPDQQEHIKNLHATFCSQTELTDFLEGHDYIVPSPGIDISAHSKYQHKFLSELDIFAFAWGKPIIAITGTVGKTTVTTLISAICKHANIPIALGGNIGTGMLSLINQQENVEYAVLELSSWQLEYTQRFAPHIAIWTNFSENHLDRHKTMEHYFAAKYKIIAQQKAHNIAIAPLALKQNIYKHNPRATCLFFSVTKPSCSVALRNNDAVLYYHQDAVYKKTSVTTQCVASNITLPSYSFDHNWVIIIALLHALDMPIKIMKQLQEIDCALEHRLEYVGLYKGAHVFNDSKSTTIASTLASIEKFAHKKVHLFLGGLSKGSDRTPLIHAIQGKNIKVYCFGKESASLHTLCMKCDVISEAYQTLEQAVTACKEKSQQGDIILFSPAGSSFDLFSDYADRGTQFKKMMQTI